MGLIAINYHYVRPRFGDPYPGIYGVTPEQLRRQLELLGRVGTFVSGEDVRAAIDGRRPLPERALLVTFDDGLREQLEAAGPVLRRLGIPALYFVNSRPLVERTISTTHKIHLLRAHVPPAELLELLTESARAGGIALELAGDPTPARQQYPYDRPEIARLKYTLNVQLPQRARSALVQGAFDAVFGEREEALSAELYLDRDQLRGLAASGELGSHGHRHLPLATLPAAEATTQLARALEILERLGGCRPYALSYPFGSREACSPALAARARELGMSYAFTMERAVNVDFETPFLLARFDCNDLPGGKAPHCRLEEVWDRLPRPSWFRPSEIRT